MFASTRRHFLHRAIIGTAAITATLLPLSASSALAATQRDSAARFLIIVDGEQIASFSECADAQAGASTPSLVLKRGTSRSHALWAWHEAARTGLIGYRRDLDVVMFDASGKPVARYVLESAWPFEVSISGLKAGSSEVMIETVTLVAERVQRVSM